MLCISIHALRKESDPIDTRAQDLIAISIHALRKESDLLESVHFIRLIAISIHALRKESDYAKLGGYWRVHIFQSTLSVRRATTSQMANLQVEQFQSTLSVRRATKLDPRIRIQPDISIHALRKESDWIISNHSTVKTNFNPRSP